MIHQYRGRLTDADRAYHDALDAGRLLDAAPADLAWMHTITGELDLDGWGDLDGAASHFLAALSLDPDAAHATIGLAEIDLRRADPGAARDRLLALVDHHDSPRAWITLGRALQATGDDGAAARWFDRAEAVMVAELDAGEIGHVRELVDLWTRLGREPERCVQLALADLEEVRQDSAAFVTVAWALHAAGRSDEAATYMDRALSMGGVDARVLWRAGRVYAAAGRDLPARRTQALAFRHPGALESTMTGTEEG
jgi:tetratricopeptide (TPR) repeat protein